MEESANKPVVLVVDDDAIVRMVVSNMLRKEGFAPQVAVSYCDGQSKGAVAFFSRGLTAGLGESSQHRHNL